MNFIFLMPKRNSATGICCIARAEIARLIGRKLGSLRIPSGIYAAREGHALLPVVLGGHSAEFALGQDLLLDPQNGFSSRGTARHDFPRT